MKIIYGYTVIEIKNKFYTFTARDTRRGQVYTANYKSI
jgi:hypothetical protein